MSSTATSRKPRYEVTTRGGPRNIRTAAATQAYRDPRAASQTVTTRAPRATPAHNGGEIA
jgi:hypothetical protein